MPTQAPVALITGAARRIGAAIAKTLHTHGFDVLIHAHLSKSEAQSLAKQLNTIRSNSAQTCFADLSNPASAQTLIQQTLAWKNRLDCLVHNASLFIASNTLTPESSQTLFDVNLRAPYLLSREAQPYIAKQNGCILYLTDIHAYKPLKGYDLYCQTKAALHMQMLAFAQSFAPEIRVNAIAPGAIAWPEGENTLCEQKQAKIIEATALKRHGRPEDIAQAALAMIQNDFITGQVLKVDGGR